MGKDNRQRRAKKARQRQQQRQRPPLRLPPSGTRRRVDDDPGRPTSQLLVAAALAHAGGRDLERDRLLDVVADRPVEPTSTAAARLLEDEVGRLWERGWQPADVVRLARKDLDADVVAVLVVTLGAQARGYAELGRRVAPAWMAQLDAADAPVDAADLAGAVRGAAATWWDSLALAVLLVAFARILPELPMLAEPPSRWSSATSARPEDVPAALLERIRALLAKAESTTFDAEAEAFTAKAQELMARHRIDRAVLTASAEVDDLAAGVVGRRIGVDDPYADAKATLLSRVAEANGARAVWAKRLGSSTVFGFPVELDVIEELYTSLLVQATAALRREGSKQDRWGNNRTKAFRRSFLAAYAHRIGDRLDEAVAQAVDEATTSTGTDLVPVLAARDEAAESVLRQTFPTTGSFRPSVSDAEGVFAGRLAADRADLSAGPHLAR